MTSITVNPPCRPASETPHLRKLRHCYSQRGPVHARHRTPRTRRLRTENIVSLGTRHGAEASDTLKYFAERLPVTFAYAGINVERAGLLSGTRGEQIAGRFSMIRTGPFGRGQQWQSLIATLEDSLRLHHHRDGTLVGLSSYLHSRSGGMIGSLLRLIRAAAIQAVLDGTEAITKATLESIPVDIASAGDHMPG